MQHGFGSFAASARSGGDLPSILQALQSGHIGTARPSYVEDGMVWHKHRPSEGLAGTIEKYFTFGGVDHLEGAFDLSSGKYSGAGGGAPTIQVFTASGTWTRPEGCIGIKITITGGGQGGSDRNAGGSNAATGILLRDVTGLASATITIGAGGAGTRNTSYGSNGGSSIWVGGGTITANGGLTAGATATGADLALSGSTRTKSSDADGASSYWGQGAGASALATGYDGVAYGSGGGRGDDQGGDGAPGVCVVEEFY